MQAAQSRSNLSTPAGIIIHASPGPSNASLSAARVTPAPSLFLPEANCTFGLAPKHVCSGRVSGVHEWAGPEAGTATTTVVFLHATGFHSRVWDGTVAALQRRLGARAVRCLAVDLLGHGRSSKPTAKAPADWAGAAADAVEAVAGVGVVSAVWVGHSGGGWCALQAACTSRPGAVIGLALIDPVVNFENARRFAALPPEERGAFWERFNTIERRFNGFVDAATMQKRFLSRSPFSTWDPRCLADYCDTALLGRAELARLVVPPPPPQGGAVDDDALLDLIGVPRSSELPLACPPMLEQRWYQGGVAAPSQTLLERLEHLTIPTVVLLAEDLPRGASSGTFLGSPTDPALLDMLPGLLPEISGKCKGLNHFMPMQKPNIVAEKIEQCCLAAAAGHQPHTTAAKL